MSDDPLRRPIGWWLKRVDGLLDLGFEATLGARDVSRRQWQILNGLIEGTPPAELLASLTVFEASGGVHEALASLVERGWLRSGSATDVSISAAPANTGDASPVEATGTSRVETTEMTQVELTVEGRQQHAFIGAEVRAMRTSVTEGLSADDYRAVITGLARMAENLERRLA